MVPTRGTYLKAAAGTAVGLVFEWGDKVVVALPGPPRELQPMVRNELVPYLRQKFGVHSPGSSITLRFVGIGQSLIDQTMSQHVPLPLDVIVGSQFEGGRVDFEFMLAGNGPEQEARLKQLTAKVREHLGEYIYAESETTLEQHVAQTLLARGAKLALVEIGTGGRLAASLAGLPETSRLLKGAHVAPSEEAMQALLKSNSRELKALAQADGGDWVIVTGGMATDKAGARSCTVLFRLGGERWEQVRVPVQGTGETASAGLVTNIWDRLRRLLK
jgi:nicotinamide-nucleotide amidase